jgi:murein DD-endopeptidase MepM/ murein hydrolase activator NlpD
MKGALLALLAALVVLSAGSTGVTADTASNAQQQRAVIEQIRAQLGSSLADAMAAQQQLRQSLQDNAIRQQELRAKIDEVQAKITALDVQIAESQRREAFLAKRIESERAQLRQLARSIYVAPTSTLVMLGESQSLSDLLTRISDLGVAGSRASEIKVQLAKDLTEQQAQRKKQEDARAEQVKQREQLDSQFAQLQKLQAEQQTSMDDLEVKIGQTRYLIAQLNRQSAQLSQQIADMLQQQQNEIIAAAMQSVWTQMQLWSQSNNVGQIPMSAGHSTKYRFIWPEPQAQISQGFGPSPYPFEPPYGGFPHYHTGMDLVEPFGSPVYAADDGIVALVGGTTAGYGNYVVIAHAGGLDTLYAHLSTALVRVGQTVSQGQAVGMEGSTGNSTGAHLHFELRINQRPVDPAPYLPPGAPSPFRG